MGIWIYIVSAALLIYTDVSIVKATTTPATVKEDNVTFNILTQNSTTTERSSVLNDTTRTFITLSAETAINLTDIPVINSTEYTSSASVLTNNTENELTLSAETAINVTDILVINSTEYTSSVSVLTNNTENELVNKILNISVKPNIAFMQSFKRFLLLLFLNNPPMLQRYHEVNKIKRRSAENIQDTINVTKSTINVTESDPNNFSAQLPLGSSYNASSSTYESGKNITSYDFNILTFSEPKLEPPDYRSLNLGTRVTKCNKNCKRQSNELDNSNKSASMNRSDITKLYSEDTNNTGNEDRKLAKVLLKLTDNSFFYPNATAANEETVSYGDTIEITLSTEQDAVEQKTSSDSKETVFERNARNIDTQYYGSTEIAQQTNTKAIFEESRDILETEIKKAELVTPTDDLTISSNKELNKGEVASNYKNKIKARKAVAKCNIDLAKNNTKKILEPTNTEIYLVIHVNHTEGYSQQNSSDNAKIADALYMSESNNTVHTGSNNFFLSSGGADLSATAPPEKQVLDASKDFLFLQSYNTNMTNQSKITGNKSALYHQIPYTSLNKNKTGPFMLSPIEFVEEKNHERVNVKSRAQRNINDILFMKIRTDNNTEATSINTEKQGTRDKMNRNVIHYDQTVVSINEDFPEIFHDTSNEDYIAAQRIRDILKNMDSNIKNKYENMEQKMVTTFGTDYTPDKNIKPLLFTITLPSFICICLVIAALCFILRTDGWCCRLFSQKADLYIVQPTQSTK